MFPPVAPIAVTSITTPQSAFIRRPAIRGERRPAIRGNQVISLEYGEHNVVCRLIRSDRWIQNKFQDQTEPVHPSIRSSDWATTTTQTNMDVKNFTKLFRTFDFPNNVRMSLTLLHKEFTAWRRYQPTSNSWLRTNITMADFGTMIHSLGFMSRPTRGYSTALGNCRQGYNVFIYGSVQCSDTNTFIGRVLVDPPQTALLAPTQTSLPPIFPTSLGERGLFSTLISAIRIIQLNRLEGNAESEQHALLNVIHRRFEPAFTFSQVRSFYRDFIVSDDMDALIEMYSWMESGEH
jgi:hypothetical protein